MKWRRRRRLQKKVEGKVSRTRNARTKKDKGGRKGRREMSLIKDKE